MTGVVGTGALLAARLWAAPPIVDPTGAALPDGLHLTVPWSHVLVAPLFTLWDGTTMLSLSRLKGLVAGLAVFYVLWRLIRVIQHGRILRELGLAIAAVTGFATFVVGGALWHRPMVGLAGTPSDRVVVDFHAHTNASHDVQGLMQNFDVEASRRWHGRAGFDAFFVTDHNTVGALTARPRDAAPPYVCNGIEISAWRAHILLLGTTDSIDRRPYTDSLSGVLALLRDAPERYGALSIASIPEYERHHWNNLDALLAAGLHGFEIVNASPKANELSRARRDSVIALARRGDRVVLGVSDSHGWGATSMVWNLVPMGMRLGPGEDPCPRILSRLSGSGFEAAQIVERHRLRADARWPWLLTPVGLIWETWRGMGWKLALGWLAWIWGVVFLVTRRRGTPGLAKQPSRRPR